MALLSDQLQEMKEAIAVEMNPLIRQRGLLGDQLLEVDTRLATLQTRATKIQTALEAVLEIESELFPPE